MLLLKNATVYPQTEKAPFMGDVLCENGRIKEIGKDLSADDAETIDLTGLNLLPGIVDCHSHAGLGPNGDVATLSYCTDTANPVSPEMDVIYAADPTNGCYRWAIENGVTTLGILPGSCDVIDGTGFATRTWGSNIFEMCLKRNICMKLSLGENPKGMFQNKNMEPDSRMGVTFILEEYFANAKAYMDKKDRGEKNNGKALAHKNALFGRQFVNRRSENITIEHAWGSSNYLDEIVASGCGIVYGPIGGRKSFYESRFVDVDAVAKLDEAGTLCCLTVDSPLEGLDSLLSHAEQAVREGADPIRVMRMITINPAKVIGLDAELGSIEVGKYANFAVFKGLPGTDMGAHVVYTIGEGSVLYHRN